jgi:hypothetical protein
MKFTKVLTIVLAICLKFSQANANIKIWAFGDVGQIDPWWRQSLIHKQAAKMKGQIPDEKIYKIGNDIKTRISSETLSQDKYDLFKNLKKIHQCPGQTIHSSVILGDGVYTEHKGGLLQNLFGDTNKDTRDNSAVGKDDSRKIFIKTGDSEKTDLSTKYGERLVYASKKLLEFMEKPTANCEPGSTYKVDILPGNHNYDVNPDLERETINTWAKRREWIAPKWKETIQKDDVSVAFLDINLMALQCLGSESYSKCISSQGGAGYASLPGPQKALEYLKELVLKLAQSRHNLKNVSWRVIRTHNPLYNPEADFNIAIEYEIPDLRICFNTKCGNLQTVFEDPNQNYDGNLSPAYQVFPSGTPTGSQGKKYKLIDLFKLSKVDFWLASHFHAAMFIAAPFDRQRVNLERNYNGDFLNADSPKKCVDRFSVFFAQSSKPSGSPPSATNSDPRTPFVTLSTMTDCPENSVADVQEIEIEKSNPQSLLLQFIIGNSGRMLDPLKSDEKSNGDLVWARSYGDKYIDVELDKKMQGITLTPDNFEAELEKYILGAKGQNGQPDVKGLVDTYNNKYGFAEITFEKTSAYIEFKEEKGADLITVKKFKLTKTDIPKKYAINYMLTGARPSASAAPAPSGRKLKKKLK